MYYFVYILLSLKDNNFYIGFTNNLKRRFKEHKNGFVFSTKNRRPLELVYFEYHRNHKDALAREKFFKTGWGRNYCKRILSNFLREKNIKI